ncbi:MAG: DUF2207 domain-containing protein [Bacilli bacterium]|nr:DUF2207 domain-containing protein [Bacilli bacterium]
MNAEDCIMKLFLLTILIITYLLPENAIGIKTSVLEVLILFWLLYVISYILCAQAKKNKINKHEKNLQIKVLPQERTVLELGYLLKGRITSSMLGPSILELIRKKVLLLKKSSDGKDYIFVSNKNLNDFLTDSEKFLLNWFMNNIGNGESVSLSLIKRDAYTNSTYFLTCYYDWHSLASFEGTRAKLVETKSKIMDQALGYIALSIICILLGIIYHSSIHIVSLGILFTVILIVYISNYYFLRTEEGSNQYLYWRSFGKGIENLSVSKITKNITSLEKTVVYAKLLHKNVNKLLDYVSSKDKRLFDDNEFIMYAKSGDINRIYRKINRLVPGALVTSLIFSKNKGSRAPLKRAENKEV